MTFLQIAVDAARAAGGLLRANFGLSLNVDSTEAHDIKLELDRRSQRLIEGMLLDAFPETSVLGEEGSAGNSQAELQWIVDPIDGTVNFFYGIPHFCISIALRRLATGETLVRVIYDPIADELWTAERGSPALLNGRPIQVSRRTDMGETVISIGASKTPAALAKALPLFTRLIPQVCKVRMFGSAALAMTYVASGRLDAYIEYQVSIWDIAAGALILECAGGNTRFRSLDNCGEKFAIVASSGCVDYEVSLD